jgi:hypothetical protein
VQWERARNYGCASKKILQPSTSWNYLSTAMNDELLAANYEYGEAQMIVLDTAVFQ